MSQDPAIRGKAEDSATAVVEWGDGDQPRSGRAARRLAHWRSDRRLAPLIAGIAGLALFGSLVSEWRMWTPNLDGSAPRQVTEGVASFAAVGSGYLVGLFLLAACGGLALFGADPVRRHARLAGLAVAAVLGALVLAAMTNLDQLGGTVDYALLGRDGAGELLPVESGRGIYLALAGVVVAAVALYLAAPGQRATAPPPTTESAARAGHEVESTAGWAPADGEDWPWRPRGAGAGRAAPPGPADLTVEPSTPFLPPQDPDTR